MATSDHILCNEGLDCLDCLADPLVAVQLEGHGNDDDPINKQLSAWGLDADYADCDYHDCQSMGLQGLSMLHMFEDFNLLTPGATAAAQQAAGEAEAAAQQPQAAVTNVAAGAEAERAAVDGVAGLQGHRNRSPALSRGGSVDIQNSAIAIAAAAAAATPAAALRQDPCRATSMTAGSSNVHYLSDAAAAVAVAAAEATSLDYVHQAWPGAPAVMTSDARGVAQLLQGSVYGLQQHQMLLSNSWVPDPGQGQNALQQHLHQYHPHHHQQQQQQQDTMQHGVLEVLDFSQMNDIEFSKQVQQMMSVQQQLGHQPCSHGQHHLVQPDAQPLPADVHTLQHSSGFSRSMGPALHLAQQELLISHLGATGAAGSPWLPLPSIHPGDMSCTEWQLACCNHAVAAAAAAAAGCRSNMKAGSKTRPRAGSRNGTTAAHQNLRQPQKGQGPCSVEQQATQEVSEVLRVTASNCTASTLAAPVVQFMPIDWGRDKAEKQRQDRESKARKRKNLRTAAAATGATAACGGATTAPAAMQLPTSHEHVVGIHQATATVGSTAATSVVELSPAEADASSDSQQAAEHSGKQKKYNLGPVKVFRGICGMLSRMVKSQAAKTALMKYITEAPEDAAADVLVRRLAEIAQDIAAERAAEAEAEAEEGRTSADHTAGSKGYAVPARTAAKQAQLNHAMPVAKPDAEPLPRAGLDLPALECFWKYRLAALVKEACISLQSRELVEADLALQNPSLNPSGMLLMGFKLPLEPLAPAGSLTSAQAEVQIAAADVNCAAVSAAAAVHAASTAPHFEMVQPTSQLPKMQPEQPQLPGQTSLKGGLAQQQPVPPEAQPGWQQGIKSAKQEQDAVLAAAKQIEHAATLAEALQLARIAAQEARWRRWQLQPHQQHRWQEIQKLQEAQQQQQPLPEAGRALQEVLSFHAVGLQLGFELDQSRRQHCQAALGGTLEGHSLLRQEEKDRLCGSLQQLLQHGSNPATGSRTSQRQEQGGQQAQGSQHQGQGGQTAACSAGTAGQALPWGVPMPAQADEAMGRGMPLLHKQHAGTTDHNQHAVLQPQQQQPAPTQSGQHVQPAGTFLPCRATVFAPPRQPMPALDAGEQQVCISQSHTTADGHSCPADAAAMDVPGLLQLGRHLALANSPLAGVAGTAWHAQLQVCTSHTLQQQDLLPQGGLAVAGNDTQVTLSASPAAPQATAVYAAATATGAQLCCPEPPSIALTAAPQKDHQPAAGVSHHQRQQEQHQLLELPINVTSANAWSAGEARALLAAVAPTAAPVEVSQGQGGAGTLGPQMDRSMLPAAPAPAAVHQIQGPALPAVMCNGAAEGDLIVEVPHVATVPGAAEGTSAAGGAGGESAVGMMSQTGVQQLPATAAWSHHMRSVSEGPGVAAAAAGAFMHLGQDVDLAGVIIRRKKGLQKNAAGSDAAQAGDVQHPAQQQSPDYPVQQQCQGLPSSQIPQLQQAKACPVTPVFLVNDDSGRMSGLVSSVVPSSTLPQAGGAAAAGAATGSAPTVLQTSIECDEHGWLTAASLRAVAMSVVDLNAVSVQLQPDVARCKATAVKGHTPAAAAAAAGPHSSSSAQHRPRIRHIKALNEFVHSLQQKDQPQQGVAAVAGSEKVKEGAAAGSCQVAADGNSMRCGDNAATTRVCGQKFNNKRKRQRQHTPASKRRAPARLVAPLVEQEQSGQPAEQQEGPQQASEAQQQQQQQAQPVELQQQQFVRRSGSCCSIRITSGVNLCQGDVTGEGIAHQRRELCCPGPAADPDAAEGPAAASTCQPAVLGEPQNMPDLTEAPQQGEGRGCAPGDVTSAATGTPAAGEAADGGQPDGAEDDGSGNDDQCDQAEAAPGPVGSPAGGGLEGLQEAASTAGPGMKKQKREQKNVKRRDLTLQQVRQCYHLPLREAADELGVCVTVLKAWLRENRVGRWPYRKHNSVHNLIQVVQQHGLDSSKQEECNRVCLELQSILDQLTEDPNRDLEDRVKKLRQAIHKIQYKQRKKDQAASGSLMEPPTTAAAATGMAVD